MLLSLGINLYFRHDKIGYFLECENFNFDEIKKEKVNIDSNF